MRIHDQIPCFFENALQHEFDYQYPQNMNIFMVDHQANLNYSELEPYLAGQQCIFFISLANGKIARFSVAFSVLKPIKENLWTENYGHHPPDYHQWPIDSSISNNQM